MEAANSNGFNPASVCRTLVSNAKASDVVAIRWRGSIIHVKKLIEFDEYINFVFDIIDMCTNDEGRLRLELIDFAFRANIIDAFTDIEMPTEVAEQFRLVFWTDLYKVVSDNINHEQFESLRKTVDLLVKG